MSKIREDNQLMQLGSEGYQSKGSHPIYATDVGHTATAYAKAAKVRREKVVRLSPYMGRDSIEPWVEQGISVEIVGCLWFLLGDHSLCKKTREVMESWGLPGLRVMSCREVMKEYGDAGN